MAQSLRETVATLLGVTGIIFVAFLGRPIEGRGLPAGTQALAAAFVLLAGWRFGGQLAAFLAPAAAASVLSVTELPSGKRLLVKATTGGLVVAGVYSAAVQLFPWAWHANERLALGWSALAGRLVDTACEAGPSFVVPEVPLLVGVLGVMWLRGAGAPPGLLAGWVLGMLALHTGYLTLVAVAPHLLAALPPPPPVMPLDVYTPPPWQWAEEVRRLVPWNLPALACLLSLTLLALTIGLSRKPVLDGGKGLEVGSSHTARSLSDKDQGILLQLIRVLVGSGTLRIHMLSPQLLAAELFVVGAGVALFMPVIRTPEGLTVVAWRGGFLRPSVPENADNLEMGSWGGLGVLLASWGSRLEISDELTQEELKQADVVLVVHPDRPWPRERVERLTNYVREGGRLLFVGGYYFHDGERKSQFDQLLQPLGARASFQTIVHPGRSSAEAIGKAFHPAIPSGRGPLRIIPVSSGAPLEVGWSAQPLLWSPWAWADTGSDVLLTGQARWEGGERLGDLVLAAEIPFGKGRVIAWGNPEIVADHNCFRHYALLGRILSYLADGSPRPRSLWRVLVLTLGAIGLLGVGLWAPPRVSAEVLLLSLVVVAAAVGLSNMVQADFVPDGRRHPQWNNVVAIDLGHYNHGALEPWSPDGYGAFNLMLLRYGYLPIGLERLNRSILERCGIFLTVAPQRAFRASEQAAVEEFLKGGGVFIATVGADRSAACRAFLRRLGLDPGRYPVPASSREPEPEPMGCIHTFYRPGDVDYDAGVLFYAAWPVGCSPEEHVVRGKNNLPVVAARQVGRGLFVLIGDSDFVLNTNLEFTREPIDGRTLNQAFWRWFLSWLTPQPDWFPPPAPERAPVPAESKPGLPALEKGPPAPRKSQ